jgi:hypothetical protein
MPADEQPPLRVPPGRGPPPGIIRADTRTRTGDPFITSEVLYQLSYVGAPRIVASKAGP